MLNRSLACQLIARKVIEVETILVGQKISSHISCACRHSDLGLVPWWWFSRRLITNFFNLFFSERLYTTEEQITVNIGEPADETCTLVVVTLLMFQGSRHWSAIDQTVHGGCHEVQDNHVERVRISISIRFHDLKVMNWSSFGCRFEDTNDDDVWCCLAGCESYSEM